MHDAVLAKVVFVEADVLKEWFEVASERLAQVLNLRVVLQLEFKVPPFNLIDL